jgi:hypothetical protein
MPRGGAQASGAGTFPPARSIDELIRAGEQIERHGNTEQLSQSIETPALSSPGADCYKPRG